jgi:hypothetical protein
MRIHPIFLALALTACPESPDDLEGGSAEGNAGPATPSDQPGTPGEAPTIDATMDVPKHSQEELETSPDAVKIGGQIRCEEGGGPYRVRVFVPPPSEGGPAQETEGEPPGPLAAATFAEAGPFEMYTPKGDALKLLAYEDADENGVPTPEETQFGTVGGELLDLSASKMDINLDCSASAPVPKPIPAKTEDGPTGDAPPDLEGEAPAEGATPEGGTPDGPPPPEGAPAGPPPEGAL